MRAVMLFALLAGCSHPVAPHPASNAPAIEHSPVTQTGSHEWTVTLVRTSGRYSASGVVMTSTMPTTTEPVPYAGLAAARAWRTIAVATKVIDPRRAAEAAFAGIEEVEKLCKPRPDDTMLRIDVAKGAFERGNFKSAAVDGLTGLQRRIRQCLRKTPEVKVIPDDDM